MDTIDEAEGPRVQMINNNEIRLLYTSLFGLQTPFDLVSTAFAIYLIVFGLIGYFVSGSKISLIASIGISLPILIGSYLTTKHVYWSLLTLGKCVCGFQVENFFLSFSTFFIMINIIDFFSSRHSHSVHHDVNSILQRWQILSGRSG